MAMRERRRAYFFWLVALAILLLGVWLCTIFLNPSSGKNSGKAFSSKTAEATVGKEPKSALSIVDKYTGSGQFPSLELVVRETKTGGRIDFVVEKYEYKCLGWESKKQFEANCAWPYRYDPDIEPVYSVRTYNRNGRQIAAYETHSARFLFWDDLSDPEKPKGGCEEQPYGFIAIRLPCDSRVESVRIRIEANKTTAVDMEIENAGEEMELLRFKE